MGNKKKSRSQSHPKAAGASLPVPQDPKPVPNSGVLEVVVDEVEISLDLSVLRDIRIMRKIRNDDQDAIIDFYERLFPDQLDELEERFDLSDIEDYNQLLKQCMDVANPN